MELAPGVQLTPKLTIVRQLGEGGMSTVWEAEHRELNARVAVKVLGGGNATIADAKVARFHREATAAGRIDSPHVAALFDSGTLGDGRPYLVMELLEGEDLGEKLKREGSLSITALLPIVDQISRALQKAHDRQIVHRDVKPDNVFLLDEDGDTFVKLLDFGVAKRVDHGTHSVVTITGAMVGTPAYMSPEQVLSGKDVDRRADVWGLGVLVYRALTGEIPFNGDTLGAMCVSISKGHFIPATQHQASLPRALDSWFDRALAIAPDDRFASARDAARALRKAARGISAAVSRTIVMANPERDDHSSPPADPWLADPGDIPMKRTSRGAVALIVAGSLAGVATVGALLSSNEPPITSTDRPAAPPASSATTAAIRPSASTPIEGASTSPSMARPSAPSAPSATVPPRPRAWQRSASAVRPVPLPRPPKPDHGF